MAFPIQRLRRLRQHESLRRMVRKRPCLPPTLSTRSLWLKDGIAGEIASMPGQYRLSIDLLIKEAGEVKAWVFQPSSCSAYRPRRMSAAAQGSIRRASCSVP